MPNKYGIPEDSTDATPRGGVLAPALNAAGYASGDLDVRVADHEDRITDLEELTESTADKVQRIEDADYATKVEVDSLRSSGESKDESQDNAIERLDVRMGSLEAAQISTGVNVAPGSSVIPPYPTVSNPGTGGGTIPDPSITNPVVGYNPTTNAPEWQSGGGGDLTIEGYLPDQDGNIGSVSRVDHVTRITFDGVEVTEVSDGVAKVAVSGAGGGGITIQGSLYADDGTLNGTFFREGVEKLVFAGPGVTLDYPGGDTVRAFINGGGGGSSGGSGGAAPMPPSGHFITPWGVRAEDNTSFIPTYMCFIPFTVSETISVDKLAVRVAGTNEYRWFRMALYSNGAFSNRPAQRLATTSLLEGYSSGVVSSSITETQLLPGQLYWQGWYGYETVRLIADNLSPTTLISASDDSAFSGLWVSTSTAIDNGTGNTSRGKAVEFPLSFPASFEWASNYSNNNSLPAIAMRRSA